MTVNGPELVKVKTTSLPELGATYVSIGSKAPYESVVEPSYDDIGQLTYVSSTILPRYEGDVYCQIVNSTTCVMNVGIDVNNTGQVGYDGSNPDLQWRPVTISTTVFNPFTGKKTDPVSGFYDNTDPSFSGYFHQ